MLEVGADTVTPYGDGVFSLSEGALHFPCYCERHNSISAPKKFHRVGRHLMRNTRKFKLDLLN